MIGQSISSNVGSPTSGGGPTTSASESADGEDQEDSSSSSNLKSNNTDDDDELASFREQWQRELEISSKSSFNIVGNNAPEPAEVNSLAENCENVSAESLEIKAKALFLKGVEHEQSGKLYEAIQFYKRAVQLVPDVEFKLYEASKPKINEKKQQMDSVSNTDNLNRASQGSLSSTENAEDDDDLDGEELLIRLQRFISRCSRLCFPEFDANCTHISALPMEIVLYILRWVVSSDLDLRSLEKFGSTCRGFYLCSRDSEIWRLACIRVWGVNCGTPGTPYASWRQMFVERPRLHFNGCYISKTTYLRHGENSFQDQFYRPWHLVEYYRYLRFFPDGTVLMLTTPDEPAQCVNQLRGRNPRNANILVGHYRLWDRTVTLFVQRQDTKYVTGHRLRVKRRDSVVDKQSQTFHLELQIQNHRKRKNAQLIFTRYAVFTRNHNGTESSSNFELVGARYPPLWFSRVKSYTAESESPLQ